MKFATVSTLAAASCVGLANAAVTFDGAAVNTDAISNGLTLLAVQDTPTQFGNATTGGQDSADGSELNALYASLDGTSLTISITGNLQANFNKFFLFLDGVDGGENTLASDNADGGFGEINSLAGLSFANGATMDHGLRFEIGGGFYGINTFDLIDNTATNAISGGGPGDLPLSNQSGGAITALGWDNSNILGVDDATAATALTADTGWEIQLDLLALFGEAPNAVGISGLITSGDATFGSNQALPGLNGAGNIGGDYANTTLPVAVIPEPASLALLGCGALLIAGRRR
jgi:hypothetical protein